MIMSVFCVILIVIISQNAVTLYDFIYINFNPQAGHEQMGKNVDCIKSLIVNKF